MKKLFLLFVLTLLSLAASADDVEYEKRKTIHVATAGTLPDLILNDEKNLIEELTITGELNGTDLAFLREMAGRSREIYCNTSGFDLSYLDCSFSPETQGKLINLDIFNASIVSGGSPYLQLIDGDDRLTNIYSSDNTIPAGIFWGCRLSSIKLPRSISNIGRSAFMICSGLTSITIPSSVTSIGYEVFNGCSSLTSVISEIESPFAIDNSVFDGIPSNAQLVVPKGKESAYRSTAGWNKFTNIVEVGGVGYIFEEDGIYYIIRENNTVSVIKRDTKYSGDIVIPSQVTCLGTPYSVTSIGSSAFAGCSSLTSVTIPSSVTSIEDNAFNGCSSLTSITIPNSVTSIEDHAFRYCTGLTSATIGSSRIGEEVFTGCTGLVYVMLSSNLTSIGWRAFWNCNSLTDVYCKAVNVPSAQLQAFSNQGDITLHVPNESLNAYQTTYIWKEFKNFWSLSSSELQASEKCSKPTISIVDGRFVFNSETSNVSYNWSISTPNGTNGRNYSSVSLPITLNVFATKSGYLPSDVATYEFSGLAGDVNNDGEVNVADHVKLSDIIMGQE